MPRVLLVDDSATDRALLQGLLERDEDLTVRSCANGCEAMECLLEETPDVVVTDLQMPDMDGLELVAQIRQRYSRLPVILITGHGSESLAVKALRRGAAGYVPKNQCTELLRPTIEHVYQLTYEAANYDRLIGNASTVLFEFQLPNDELLIAPLIDLAQKMACGMGICDTIGSLQLGVALEHAVLNAIYHGNLELTQQQLREAIETLSIEDESGTPQESRMRLARGRNSQAPYRDRRVSVGLKITRDEVKFVVRDQGPGFDAKEVAEIGLTTSLSGKTGQGMFLMWAFMDQVSFDTTGNTVTLIKRRQAEGAAAQATASQTAAGSSMPRSAMAANQLHVADEAKLEVMGRLTPRQEGPPLVLTRTRMTVGRDASCDIIIPSTSVSHHHCVLYLYEGWWYVKDLGSKNGVRVNRVAVTQHLIPPGSCLTIGKLEFDVDYRPHDLGSPGITPPVDPF